MRVILFTFFLCSLTFSWGKDPGELPLKDIRDVISQQEFLAAGLGRLSEDELLNLSGALYGWKKVKVESVQSLQPTAQKNRSSDAGTWGSLKSDEPVIVTARQEQGFGKETMSIEKNKEGKSNEKSSNKITSSIIGEFNGWKGDTVFELSNGQVWRQSDNSSFWAREKNPKVEIAKGFLGTYFLSVKGYGARCKVKRVK